MLLYKNFTISKHADYKDQDGNYIVIDDKPRENAFTYAYFAEDEETGKKKYFIRTNNNGRLFDPYGIYTEGYQLKKMAGQSQWKFRECAEDAFKHYTHFLRTRQEMHLRSAERVMI